MNFDKRPVFVKLITGETAKNRMVVFHKGATLWPPIYTAILTIVQEEWHMTTFQLTWTDKEGDSMLLQRESDLYVAINYTLTLSIQGPES